jgi:protein-S-isoprenylcysteine O-methyltransferase
MIQIGINPLWLGLFYALSEITISTVMRAKRDSRGADKGSLRLIWLVINISMISAMLVALFLPYGYWAGGKILYWSGFALFAFGLALRWYSIAYLGKFFTVHVAVASDQTVIDTGPYKFVRHPSYTGSLTAFLGLGLCLANVIALAVIMIPITAVFFHRIRIEEQALQAGLGDAYKNYMVRTKRLVPFVY